METKTPYLNISILMILVIALGSLYFITNKKIIEVNSLGRDVEQLSQNIQKLETLKSTLPLMDRDIASYNRTLPRNESGVAAFAQELEKIAKESSLIISFQIDDFAKIVEVSSQKMSGLGVQVNLLGGFEGITAFQSKLSQIPYFYKIDKITITKGENETKLKAILVGYLMMNVDKK